MNNEEYALGAAMLNEKAALTLVDIIKNENAFTDPLRRAFFNAIKSQFAKGSTPELISTANEVTKFIKRDVNEINAYAIGLINLVSGTSNQEEICSYINDLYLKRSLTALSPILQYADKNTDPYNLIVAEVLSKIDKLSEDLSESKANLEQQVIEVQDQVKMQALSSGIIGLRSGISILDKKTGGLQAGHLITIAGRPAMGKSVLALNIALEVSKTEKVLFFSREMTASEILKRAVCADGSFHMSELFTGSINEKRLTDFNKETNELLKRGLIINEDDYKLPDIVYQIRKQEMTGLGLVIIDYLQLLEGSNFRSNDTSQLTEITRTLKQVAKALSIPIIILSQLNRDVESRPRKIPQLSDLKQSGSIEEDSNMVILCYRPEYYEISDFPDGSYAEGKAQLIVAKNRNGGTGFVTTGFNGNKAIFYDLEEPKLNNLSLPMDQDEEGPF